MKLIQVIAVLLSILFSQVTVAEQKSFNINYQDKNTILLASNSNGLFGYGDDDDDDENDDDDEDERLEKDFKRLNKSFRVLRRTNNLEEFKFKFKAYQTQLDQMMNTTYRIHNSRDKQEYNEGMQYLEDQTLDLQEAIDEKQSLSELKKLVKKLNSTKKKYHDKLGVDDD